MKNLLLLLGVVGAGGVGVYYFLNRRPEPHWQVGSILEGEDPEAGWIREEVTFVEWRDKTYFDLNKTEYKPQWWYHLSRIYEGGNRVSSGWYPEEFLKSVVVG